jgi:hypothetical protein
LTSNAILAMRPLRELRDLYLQEVQYAVLGAKEAPANLARRKVDEG